VSLIDAAAAIEDVGNDRLGAEDVDEVSLLELQVFDEVPERFEGGEAAHLAHARLVLIVFNEAGEEVGQPGFFSRELPRGDREIEEYLGEAILLFVGGDDLRQVFGQEDHSVAGSAAREEGCKIARSIDDAHNSDGFCFPRVDDDVGVEVPKAIPPVEKLVVVVTNSRRVAQRHQSIIKF